MKKTLPFLFVLFFIFIFIATVTAADDRLLTPSPSKGYDTNCYRPPPPKTCPKCDEYTGEFGNGGSFLWQDTPGKKYSTQISGGFSGEGTFKAFSRDPKFIGTVSGKGYADGYFKPGGCKGCGVELGVRSGGYNKVEVYKGKGHR